MPGLALLASRVQEAYIIARMVVEKLGGLRGTSLAYWESGGGEPGLRLEAQRVSLDSLPLLSAKGAVMLAFADWTCVYGMRFVGGHALAHVMVCAARVPPQTQYATSLPLPLKRSDAARLLGYSWRLLDEGSSTERLAARLVKLGARASMVAIVAEQGRRKTPVAIMAAERLCVAHHGRWAAVSTTSLPDCTLLEQRLVTLKLQAGVPRVYIAEIDEYAR